MKKFLLLLSCCLSTWFGAQAASPTGRINSATYNADNSTIDAYFTSRDANKVELGLISQHAGSITSPLCKKSFGAINGATHLATLDVDPKFEEGLFQVLLYLNGSSYPSGSQQVNVTAKGRIKSPKVDPANMTFTVEYCMQHASEYYSSLRIFNDARTKQLYRENLKKKYSDPNPNTNVNSYTNYSLSYSDLVRDVKPVEGQYYWCRLYVNENKYEEIRFMWPRPVETTKGKVELAVYEPQFQTITVDYKLEDAINPKINIYDGSNRIVKGDVRISNSKSTQTVTIEDVQRSVSGYYVQISATNNIGQQWTSNKLFISNVASDDRVIKDEIKNMWYDRSSGKINVDFNLERSGAYVQLKVLDTRNGYSKLCQYDSSCSWICGRTWYCPQNCGSDYIQVPSYNSGTVLYVVQLWVNGAVKATKQIAVSR